MRTFFNINPRSSSKVKRCKAPVLYYANLVKYFNIIGGDIEKNPELVSDPCDKTIRSNSKKIYCTVCRNVTNTQSLPFSFDEFSLMMNGYHIDIVAVSETWLKDNKTQLEHVQINGYSSVWKNRESKTGGSVGFYIKEHMSFKLRHDLGKIARLR